MQTSIVRSNVRRHLAVCHSKLQRLVFVIGKTHASQPFFDEPTTRGSGAMEQHQLKASRTSSSRLHTVLHASARDAMEQHHHHRRGTMELHHNQQQQVHHQVQAQHEGQDAGDVNSVRDRQVVAVCLRALTQSGVKGRCQESSMRQTMSSCPDTIADIKDIKVITDIKDAQRESIAGGVGHEDFAGAAATKLQPQLVSSKGSTCAQALEDHGPHLLVAGAAAGMAAVAIFNSFTSDQLFFTSQLARSVLYNVPVAACLGGAGDMVAQVSSGTRLRNLDTRRTASACGINGVLQGVGTTMWLWHLNLAIPEDAIGFTSSSAILVLAAKVLLDSGLWGTVTNSLSITARRLAAGDAAVDAYRTWHTKIYAITVSEFKLWPPWGCMVFTCVPEHFQVYAFCVGGFIWNIYMSWAANYSAGAGRSGLLQYGRPTGVRIRGIRKSTHAHTLIVTPPLPMMTPSWSPPPATHTRTTSLILFRVRRQGRLRCRIYC